jgi:hypothetical protein
MWRRPRLVTADTKSPAPQPVVRLVAWSLRAGPGNGDGGGTWADNATAERREAYLPVAREGPCLASVASRVTARPLQGWTSLGAPPIPSLGGRQRRRRKGRKRTRTEKEPGTKKLKLFDIVNRKRRGAMHRPMARTPSRQRQRARVPAERAPRRAFLHEVPVRARERTQADTMGRRPAGPRPACAGQGR